MIEKIIIIKQEHRVHQVHKVRQVHKEYKAYKENEDLMAHKVIQVNQELLNSLMAQMFI
jgi:hypothetical protein